MDAEHRQRLQALEAVVRAGSIYDKLREPPPAAHGNTLHTPQGNILRMLPGLPCPQDQTDKVAKWKLALRAIKVWRSGRVSEADYAERMAICPTCPYVARVYQTTDVSNVGGAEATLVPVVPTELLYCRCCGCGHWRRQGEGSDMASKNQFAEQSCPLGFYSAVQPATAEPGVSWGSIPGMLNAARKASRPGV